MKRLALLLLVGCGGDDGATPALDAAAVDSTSVDAVFGGDPLAGIGAVTLVDMGYQFTEGPQWRDSDLVFSDIPASTIYKLDPAGPTLSVFRTPSGNSNGLAYAAGSLYAAQHDRTVTKDGTVIASLFEAKPLNSPNDITVASDGTVYFTDPPYGLSSGTGDQGFMGVYRLRGGTLTADYRSATTGERPNGIGLSPDQSRVYVDDTADGKVYTFTRGTDGALTDRTPFATTSGNPDGLAIDTAGNVFVATAAGIDVFSPTGTKWGTIAVPMQPSNCAFGDADHRTLYITAQTSLYRVKLANAGLPYN